MPENKINDENLEEVSGGRWIIKGKKPIGTVTITGTDIYVMDSPSYGEGAYCRTYMGGVGGVKYYCYQITENEGHTWYMLGKDRWVQKADGIVFSTEVDYW